MKMDKKSLLFLIAVMVLAALIGLLSAEEDQQVYASIQEAIEQSVRAEETIYERFERKDGEIVIFHDPSMDAYSLLYLAETEGGYYFRDATAWFKPGNAGFSFHPDNSDIEVKAEPTSSGMMQFTLLEQ